MDMEPVLGEVPRRSSPTCDDGGRRSAGQGVARPAGGARPDHEGGALHPVRLLRLRVQLDGGRPRLPGPGGAGQGGAVRLRRARPGRQEPAGAGSTAQHGVWDCTRCYFCQERCPKGVDPRDAIAKVGARIYQEGMHGDRGARHAKVFVKSTHKTGYLLETNLVPETVGAVAAIKDIPFAMKLVRAGKVPNPLKPHKAKKLDEVNKLNKLVGEQEKDELGRRHCRPSREATKGRIVEEQLCLLPGLSGQPVTEGARHLDPRDRRAAGVRAGRHPRLHVLRRGRRARGAPGVLPPPERADPGPGRAARPGHVADHLQRLHAQPAPGRPQAEGRPRAAGSRQRNLREVGAATYSGGVDVRHLLWEIAEGEGYERLKQIASKPLTGLKVAPFYGCQILRPSKLLGFEDPDRPQSLERIIEACGAEPVDYPSKIKCCGFPIVLAREEVALGELIQPLAEAKEAGADAMVTPCPLCHLSLDAWQGKAVARGRPGVRPADPPSGAAGRRGRRAVLRRAAVQAARGQGGPRGPQDLRRALIRAGWLRATQHSCARRTGR